VEKRNDIDEAVTALSPELKAQARKRLAALKPEPPKTSNLKPFHPSSPIETANFTIGLDPVTGAITRLKSKARNREWSSAGRPLASLSYQTLSQRDYDQFLASYITIKTEWAPKDFGKPNIETFGAQSRTWPTRLVHCFSSEDENEHRIVAELALDESGDPHSGLTAWPARIYLELVLPEKEPIVNLTLSWFGKRANRLPEALWLTFHPDAPEPKNWMLTKVDQAVSPFDVVSGGNRHMHAVSQGISYQDGRGKLVIETLDAPLLSLGEKSPIYFSNAQPDPSNGGVHFSLYNNGWGTNYIQWFGEDMQFRFTLRT
jgi:hypothetical protein